jgi:hypothetical protein
MQGSSSAYLRIDTAIDAMGPPASTPFGIIRRHVMSKFDRCFGRTLTESIALDDVQRNIGQR